MKRFTETNSDPYDRHHYRVWLRDGSFKDVETYDEAPKDLVFIKAEAQND